MDLSNADDEKSEGGGSTAKTVVEKTFGGDQWVMSQHVSVKSATSPPLPAAPRTISGFY